MKKNIPTRLSCKNSITSAMFVLLVLLEAAMMWELAEAAPVKRNDILAGTEFLSVFINGAMAPTPRRRGFRRGQLSSQDNTVAESRLNEASIFRISKAPPSPRPPVVIVTRPVQRQVAPKLYPISHKSQLIEHNRQSFTYPVEDLASIDDYGIGYKQMTSTTTPHSHNIIKINATKPFINDNNNNNNNSNSNRKVIGVSVTSSVETATSYRQRVNKNKNNEEEEEEEELNVVTRPPIEPLSIQLFSTFSTLKTTLPSTLSTSTTTTTETTSPMTLSSSNSSSSSSSSRQFINESNHSELSVEQDLQSRMSMEMKSQITTEPTIINIHNKVEIDSLQVASNPEPIEQSYEIAEINPELIENHQEPIESDDNYPQGRKIGRHYDTSLYNQPPKVYQASKIYDKSSLSQKVYGNNNGAKIYNEKNKFYNNKAEQVNSEEQEEVEKESKIYNNNNNFNERPMMEPVEINYEVDEAVSVGSNGNVHGPQSVTTATDGIPAKISSGIDPEDNHKVGYVVEGRNYRKYRVEERTPDGFIVGEYGVVSHDDGSLRGVRYTADGTINPRLIYDALMKFLAL